LGRGFISLREDEILSEMIGIDVNRQKIVCFAIGAFFMGVAGALHVHIIGVCAPESFSVLETIAVLTMIVMGGSGSFVGPIIGAIVYCSLMQALRGFQEYTNVVYGLLLILFLIFVPGGLVGLGRTILQKMSYKGRKNNVSNPADEKT
jgi:branched-chain amino acid transport system permease protein